VSIKLYYEEDIQNLAQQFRTVNNTNEMYTLNELDQTIKDKIVYNNNLIISLIERAGTDLVIPDTVTKVGKNVFKNYNDLQTI
jgi:hypothetical protein